MTRWGAGTPLIAVLGALLLVTSIWAVAQTPDSATQQTREGTPKNLTAKRKPRPKAQPKKKPRVRPEPKRSATHESGPASNVR